MLLALLLVADSVATVPIVVAQAETVSVAIQGRGHPVVFLPGLFGSAYGFRRVTPPLAEAGYQTIIIEPLGIGKSSRTRDADYSLTAQSMRIAEAMDSLGIGQAIVAAHSIGGSLAFRLAILRPDLVAGILSIEGGAAEQATTLGFRFLMRFSRLIGLYGGPGLLRRQVYSNLRKSSADPGWVTREVIEGYTADAARDLDATLDAYRGMSRSNEPWALAPRLGEVRCPVRLLIGGADHESGVPDDEMRLLLDSLPTLAVDTVPGVGHFVFEEGPAAVVDAVLRVHRDAEGRRAP